MSKFSDKIKTFWMFNLQNPVVRKGETGGFKWTFRRYWLTIETVSGNFKARFTAAEHPYGALISDKTDSNIHGFCEILYEVGMLLTSEQKFADDIQNALKRYSNRIEKSIEIKEDETEEMIAIKTEQAIQEHIELPKKQKRKLERDINGRFRKAVKNLEKSE